MNDLEPSIAVAHRPTSGQLGTPPPPTSRPARSHRRARCSSRSSSSSASRSARAAHSVGRRSRHRLDRPTPPRQRPASTGPAPALPPDAPSDFGLFWEALNVIQQNFVGRADLDPTDADLRRHPGHGPGARRHRPHRLPDARAGRRRSRTRWTRTWSASASCWARRTASRSSSRSCPAARPRQAGLKAGDVIIAVDGKSTSGSDARPARRPGPRRRGHRRSRSPSSGRRPARQLDFDITRAKIKLPVRVVDDGPGHEHRAHSLRPVLGRLRGRAARRARRGAGGRRDLDRPRPARQPRRLRRRGRQVGERVPARQDRLHPRDGRRPADPGRDRRQRAVDRRAARRAHRQQHGELGGDHVRRAPGRRPRASSSARRRSARAPCCCPSPCPTARSSAWPSSAG